MAEAASKMRGSADAAARYKAQFEGVGFVNVKEMISHRPVRHFPRQALQPKSSGRYIPLSFDAWRGQYLTERWDTSGRLTAGPRTKSSRNWVS
jgi:hypothetical protein